MEFPRKPCTVWKGWWCSLNLLVEGQFPVIRLEPGVIPLRPRSITGGKGIYQQESVILNPSALLAIHPGERYATTNFLEDFGTGIGLVPTNGLATATGEDRRAAGETCPLLLVALGGE